MTEIDIAFHLKSSSRYICETISVICLKMLTGLFLKCLSKELDSKIRLVSILKFTLYLSRNLFRALVYFYFQNVSEKEICCDTQTTFSYPVF